MLVWWQKNRYEINYSHFFRGGWRCLTMVWRVSTQNNYFCLYHWLLTYPNVPVYISWLAAATFDLFLHCVWCIILLEKGMHCGLFRGEGCNARDTYLFALGSACLQSFVTKLGIVVHHHEPECHAKTIGFYLQGQGHCVGLYNQNMTVSTISFISSKPVSLLQPNSVSV